MRTPRRFAAAVLVLSATLSGAAIPDQASADPVVPISYNVRGSTYVAKLDQTITIPRGGTFVGRADLGTGRVKGRIDLPQVKAQILVLGLIPAEATVEFVPTAPVTGRIDLRRGRISSTTSFHVHLRELKAIGLPATWAIGDRCRTSVPVTVTVRNRPPLNLAAPITVRGTYVLPKFQNCFLSTELVNLLMAGPGNKLTLRLSPRTTS